jgi:hypothetical protein
MISDPKRFVSPKIRFVFAVSASPKGEMQWPLPPFLVVGASDRGGGRASRRQEKLRKRAVKPMKSLARVNLCASDPEEP